MLIIFVCSVFLPYVLAEVKTYMYRDSCLSEVEVCLVKCSVTLRVPTVEATTYCLLGEFRESRHSRSSTQTHLPHPILQGKLPGIGRAELVESCVKTNLPVHKFTRLSTPRCASLAVNTVETGSTSRLMIRASSCQIEARGGLWVSTLVSRALLWVVVPLWVAPALLLASLWVAAASLLTAFVKHATHTFWWVARFTVLVSCGVPATHTFWWVVVFVSCTTGTSHWSPLLINPHHSQPGLLLTIHYTTLQLHTTILQHNHITSQ